MEKWDKVHLTKAFQTVSLILLSPSTLPSKNILSKSRHMIKAFLHVTTGHSHICQRISHLSRNTFSGQSLCVQTLYLKHTIGCASLNWERTALLIKSVHRNTGFNISSSLSAVHKPCWRDLHLPQHSNTVPLDVTYKTSISSGNSASLRKSPHLAWNSDKRFDAYFLCFSHIPKRELKRRSAFTAFTHVVWATQHTAHAGTMEKCLFALMKSLKECTV